MSTLIYTNGITTVSRWINNRLTLNRCNWQGTHFFTKSILELLQRLWLYKTLPNTSSMRSPFGLYREEKLRGHVHCLLCSWYQCSRDWQLLYIKTKPTYGRRGPILRTRKPVNHSLWAYEMKTNNQICNKIHMFKKFSTYTHQIFRSTSTQEASTWWG